MRWLSLVFLLLAAFQAKAQSVCLTFDDGPDMTQTEPVTPAKRNAALLKTLKEKRVSSILFVAGSRVDSKEGLGLVRAWGEAGHLIANHTYSHGFFPGAKWPLEAFEADTLKNEALLKDLPNFTRLFRFPFLKEGDTAEKRDGFRKFLKEHAYLVGCVSIDASDWYYDQRLRAWLTSHPKADPAVFKKPYLDHLWGRAQYYDALSTRVLGRSAKHVLLLHHNLVNALFIGDVIEMFRSKGWTLLGPQEAFADPVYAMQPDVLPAGESILWSLAKQKGLEGLRYPAEDDVYEKPILDKLGL